MRHWNKKAKSEEELSEETPVASGSLEPRTTCYPQDGGDQPRVVGRPRTTTYRQALPWDRRGYDTIN